MSGDGKFDGVLMGIVQAHPGTSGLARVAARASGEKASRWRARGQGRAPAAVRSTDASREQEECAR